MGDHRQGAVVIAMITVRVVQLSFDQIIDVVPMGNCLVTTARAVPMRSIMSATAVIWRAAVGISRGHFDRMFFNMTVMHVMEVALVQIIDVTRMSNRGMTAARAVGVRMICVNRVIRGHDLSFPGSRIGERNAAGRAD